MWRIWNSSLFPFIYYFREVKLCICSLLWDKDGRWNNWLWNGNPFNLTYTFWSLKVNGSSTLLGVIILLCGVQGSPKYGTELGTKEICFLTKDPFLSFLPKFPHLQQWSSNFSLFYEELEDLEVNAWCYKYCPMMKGSDKNSLGKNRVDWPFRNDRVYIKYSDKALHSAFEFIMSQNLFITRQKGKSLGLAMRALFTLLVLVKSGEWFTQRGLQDCSLHICDCFPEINLACSFITSFW